METSSQTKVFDLTLNDFMLNLSIVNTNEILMFVNNNLNSFAASFFSTLCLR